MFRLTHAIAVSSFVKRYKAKQQQLNPRLELFSKRDVF